MKKDIIRLTESDLKNVILESVKKIIKENESLNYTHFAVNKNTNLIVNGWDYSDYDNEELRQYKRDYFFIDLIDNDFNPKEYKILTKRGCLKQGINPDDELNFWSNNGQISLKDEYKK